MRRKHYGAFYFGEGAAANDPNVSAGDPAGGVGSPGMTWGANWNQPTSGDTVNVDGAQIPYYLARGNTSPYDPASLGTNDDLPSWVKPVAIAGAFVVGLSLLGIISFKTSGKRMGRHRRH